MEVRILSGGFRPESVGTRQVGVQIVDMHTEFRVGNKKKEDMNNVKPRITRAGKVY